MFLFMRENIGAIHLKYSTEYNFEKKNCRFIAEKCKLNWVNRASNRKRNQIMGENCLILREPAVHNRFSPYLFNQFALLFDLPMEIYA